MTTTHHVSAVSGSAATQFAAAIDSPLSSKQKADFSQLENKVENLNGALDKFSKDLSASGLSVKQLLSALDSGNSTTPGTTHAAVISMWDLIASMEDLNSAISNKLLVSQNQFAAFASSQGSAAAEKMNDELSAIVKKMDILAGGPDGHIDNQDHSADITHLQTQYNTTQTADQKPVTDFSSMQQLFTQLIQSTTSDITQFLQILTQCISGFGDFLSQLSRG